MLHVQSISEWAPCCIGPYSQAVCLPRITFFAGQIGLHPPTMQLLPDIDSQIAQVTASCEASSVFSPVCLSLLGRALAINCNLQPGKREG